MSGDRAVHLSTARPMRELPYDPCPGDVTGVRGLARWCREQAEELAGAARTVGGWSPLRWQGAASVAAAQRVVAVAEALQGLDRSLAGAADGLDRWAGQLADLQARADSLDAEAVTLRRQLDASAVVDPSGPVTRTSPQRLDLQRRLEEVVDRAGALQQEYAGVARRAADVLDAAAPTDRATLDRWWRGSWDAWLDGQREGTRRQARWLDWGATALSSGSAAAGAASLVPPLAPVAAPVSAGLSVEATRTRGLLVLGAGGSTDALGRSALGSALSVAGAGATAVGAGAAAAGAGSRAAVELGEDATVTALVLEVHGWSTPGRGEPWTEERVGVDGEPFDVTVHDVEQPWHTGVGLRGHGFAVMATTAARTTAPPRPGSLPPPTSTSTATSTSRSGPTPRPAPTSRPAPAPRPDPDAPATDASPRDGGGRPRR